MDSPDVSRAALERLLTPPEGDRMELIVTYRRYDDYEAYEREIADLRQRYQRVQDEVYRWQLILTPIPPLMIRLRNARLIPFLGINSRSGKRSMWYRNILTIISVFSPRCSAL